MTELIKGTMIVDLMPQMHYLAVNFRQQLEYELQLLVDDPDSGDLPDRIRRLNNKGLILRKFQQKILDCVNNYHSIFDDDDLVESVINNNMDETFAAVIAMIGNFDETFPHLELLSIVPVDMDGNTGFIIKPKR